MDLVHYTIAGRFVGSYWMEIGNYRRAHSYSDYLILHADVQKRREICREREIPAILYN